MNDGVDGPVGAHIQALHQSARLVAGQARTDAAVEDGLKRGAPATA